MVASYNNRIQGAYGQAYVRDTGLYHPSNVSSTISSALLSFF